MIAAKQLGDGADPVEYTIGELSRMYGVSFRTLRLYEEKELLKPRRFGLSRYYSARDKIRLELVLTGKRLGFTLAEIWELLDAHSCEPERAAAGFSQTLSKPQLERQIEHLEQQRNQVNSALEELHRACARFEAGERSELRMVSAG